MVEVAADQVSILYAHYAVVPPLLRFNGVEGLTVSGTVNTAYRLEFKDRLEERIDWTPLATVTLTNGLAVFPPTVL